MNSFRKGVTDGLPIFFGYLPVGFAFGMSAVLGGLSPVQATLISALNVTSAGQFAGIQLIAAEASLVEMAFAELIINLRYALMSLSLSQKVDSSVRTVDRLLISFVNTDEVFAVASGQKGEVGRNYLYGLILTPFVGWTGGTVLGAFLGEVLPASVTSALGVALYAMFIAIVAEGCLADAAVIKVAALAAVLSCLFAFVPTLGKVSAGVSIILCTVIAAAAGAVLFPVKEVDPDEA